jgi:hypothetical protein
MLGSRCIGPRCVEFRPSIGCISYITNQLPFPALRSRDLNESPYSRS